MKNDAFEKYNDERDEIIAEYNKNKVMGVMASLITGVVLLVFDIVMYVLDVFNIAVALVLGAMIVMIAIIFSRIRAVTIESAKQQRLRLYEQNEPEFHANFK